MEIKDLILKGIKSLSDREYTNPIFEARYILSKILEVDVSYILAYPEKEVSQNNIEKYEKVLERRKKGEPLQYIFQECEFMGIKIFLKEGVLIPRPDTEISVEKIIDISKEKESIKILEIGSGSGAVSLSLAKNLEHSKIDAVDISEIALEVTRENVKRNKLSNINVFYSNLFSNVNEKYDIIYSNPPYIPTRDIDELQVEVKSYEPMLALDGGNDGLDFYRLIIKEAMNFLEKEGYLIFEIGYNQGKDVSDLLSEQGYEVLEVVKDLSGKDRVVVSKIS